MPYSYQELVTFAVFLVCFISDALADLCDDGSRCSGKMQCCMTGCCYDDDSNMDDGRHYTYGVYRLSIWNMWYFWFVILFLMMSCFGGCGYYKHRQRLVVGQPIHRGHRSLFSILAEPYNRDTARVLTVENGGYPEHMGYVFNRGPDLNLATSMAPPPYTEVMNNPGLFPPNTKTGVPGSMSAGQTNVGNIPPSSEATNQMPQPPPYAEVANQNGANSLSATQGPDRISTHQ